jgi:short-subunit dehydrogenase
MPRFGAATLTRGNIMVNPEQTQRPAQPQGQDGAGDRGRSRPGPGAGRRSSSVESLDILINNAGVSVADDLSNRSACERRLAVNLYGTLDVTQAFLPSLTRSHGTVVNVVSLGAVAAVPVLPAYSVSKAASLSVTQSLRALLAGRGVRVYAVMPGPIDTDMVRALEIPKTPPEDVARATLDGVERGEEEIFPDRMSQSLADGWRAGVAKELERQNAAMVRA